MSVPKIWAWVLFNDADPARLWHQRRVLGRSASMASKCYVATPDNDVYAEPLLVLDQNLAAVRFCDVRWPPPAGVDRGSEYRFARDLTDVELEARMDEARQTADVDWRARQRRRGEPEEPPAGGVLLPLGEAAIPLGDGVLVPAAAGDGGVDPLAAAAQGRAYCPSFRGRVGPYLPHGKRIGSDSYAWMVIRFGYGERGGRLV